MIAVSANGTSVKIEKNMKSRIILIGKIEISIKILPKLNFWGILQTDLAYAIMPVGKDEASASI